MNLQQCLGNAPDELVDGVLGDLLSYLGQGISELLDSLWLYLVVGLWNRSTNNWH